MTSKGTQSFGSWLYRRACFSLVASAAILGALMWAQAHQPEAGDKPMAVGSPAWLAQACQPVPVGEWPSAVVIRPVDSNRAVLTTNPVLIHQALDQELAGVAHGHEVYDFCA